MTRFPLRRVALSTGVALDVAVAGPENGEPIIFLHGFPESHRTWRYQIPEFARDRRVLAPDQRGFARSSKPTHVSDYAPERIIADLMALADHFGVGSFTLAGHDWGGAIAWAAAIRRPDRVKRLIILNAPHPLIFQRSLFEDPAQRAASQYMRVFRDPAADRRIGQVGFAAFLQETTGPLSSGEHLTDEEKRHYLVDWSQPAAPAAMLNWYRASPIIVPPPGETPPRPAWIDAPFPKLPMPVLVIWGMKDKALLPCQLEGLGELVEDLTVEKVDAAHFVPWEAPEAVNAAMRRWLARMPRPVASA